MKAAKLFVVGWCALGVVGVLLELVALGVVVALYAGIFEL